MAGIQAVCVKRAQTMMQVNDRRGRDTPNHRRHIPVSCHPFVSSALLQRPGCFHND